MLAECFPNTHLRDGIGGERETVCMDECGRLDRGKILEKSSCAQCFAANLKRRSGSGSAGQRGVQQRLHETQLCGAVHLL